MAAARVTCNVADLLTTDEILSCGGPDFLAGEETDEPPDWHQGWDHAVLTARGEVTLQ
jgi:hypothetical protein